MFRQWTYRPDVSVGKSSVQICQILSKAKNNYQSFSDYPILRNNNIIRHKKAKTAEVASFLHITGQHRDAFLQMFFELVKERGSFVRGFICSLQRLCLNFRPRRLCLVTIIFLSRLFSRLLSLGSFIRHIKRKGRRCFFLSMGHSLIYCLDSLICFLCLLPRFFFAAMFWDSRGSR